MKQIKPITTLIPSTLCALLATSLATSVAAQPEVEQRALTTTKAPAIAQPSKEWQMYQRIQALNAELAKLQDKVERLEALQLRQKKNTAKRLEALEKRLDDQETALIEVREENETNADSATGNASEVTSDDSPSNPLTKRSNQPVDEAAAKKAYLAAYDAYKKDGVKAGIAGMDAFIKNYAGSKLIASAHYWAGEFYLSEKQPDLDAAELRFATVVNSYPKDSKVPRALYRLGNLADANNKVTLARKYMRKIVTDHPNTKEAALANTYLKKTN